MQVGIQFFPDVGPQTQSARDYYWHEALRLVSLCDRYGHSHVRTVEHYFHPYGGYSPNPIVFLAAATQITRKARMVTGAVLRYLSAPASDWTSGARSADYPGCEIASLQLNFNDIPLAAAEASMRLFGDRVLPRL